CSRTCGAVAIENAASTDCEGMQYKKVCPLLCLAGFFATADLYCGAQGWQDIANASTLPRCLQVRCAGPLPAVPGADESDGSHGCGQAVGANCSDVTCPPGSVLSGHFQCGALGLWEAVGDVRCVEQQCPALSPLSTVCGDRALGATCPLSCPPGYSSAGFRCVGGTWQPLAEPVECTPGACRGVPSLMNALEPEACRNLPSGQTCAGACVAPWVPWGVFRCESMRWVEVPLCLPQTDGGDLVEAIAMSALLEPDTEVTAYTLEDWAVLAEDALELALQRQLAQQVPATLPLTVKATGRLAELGGRRLQELKPATWRLEYQVMIIPSAAATEALAALPQLPLATAVLQVLPPPRPALRLTTSQRLAPLPRSAATALAAEALVLTTTTTTTTQLSYVSEISRETQNTTQTSEEPEVGLDERLVALLVLLPVGCVLGFCVSRRLRRFFTSSHEVTTEAEKVDFQFVLKEEQLGEDAAENQVSISQVKHHARMRSMESQRDDLHQTMTATIMAKAAAEVEAERAAGDSQAMAMARSSEKQLPEFDRAMEALQDPQAYMAQMGTSHEPERIEKVQLSRRVGAQVDMVVDILIKGSEVACTVTDNGQRVQVAGPLPGGPRVSLFGYTVEMVKPLRLQPGVGSYAMQVGAATATSIRNVVEVCTGIGALGQGAEAAGFVVTVQNELSPAMISILERNTQAKVVPGDVCRPEVRKCIQPLCVLAYHANHTANWEMVLEVLTKEPKPYRPRCS
ncbi:unnamed protein product, partial [Effrenium voratum]